MTQNKNSSISGVDHPVDIIRYYRIFEVHCSADSTGKKMLPEADADLETLSGQKKIQ